MKNNKIIGYTDGVYDLFHVGHLNLIKEAKKQCDYLIVGVHSDSIVFEYKHKHTVISDEDRVQIISAIKYVDQAVLNHTRDKIELWKKYHFDIVFIGDDWKGTERWNKIEEELNKIGVKVVYIPYTKRISTTMIKDGIKKKWAKATKDWEPKQ